MTPRLSAAIEDRTSGATEVTRQVILGLLELAERGDRIDATADLMFDRLPWYGSMWHVVRAAHAAQPHEALHQLLECLDTDVDKTVAAAVSLLMDRATPVHAAPSSALVKAVMRNLDAAGYAGQGYDVGGSTGVAGADALGPTTVLNIAGTLDLARTRPTILVTTSLKLVTELQFQKLGGHRFERIPLAMFSAVVLDGEVLTPSEAGERAAGAGELGWWHAHHGHNGEADHNQSAQQR
ncbi:hypothetical protein [Rugosimonospora africana]|uniref:hypothetical protein n=1 Tax=Rugosimonospora africana TaxID=556532 RepID=UPI001943F35C|nr:hypothetical protein [Rugosimonospora africana]